MSLLIFLAKNGYFFIYINHVQKYKNNSIIHFLSFYFMLKLTSFD